jgi:hypothetical protein
MLHDKVKVHVNKSHSRRRKEGIQAVILNISVEALCQVFQNLMMRRDTCLQAHGHHFEHLLRFKVRIITAMLRITYTLLLQVGRRAHNFLVTSLGLAGKTSAGLQNVT